MSKESVLRHPSLVRRVGDIPPEAKETIYDEANITAAEEKEFRDVVHVKNAAADEVYKKVTTTNALPHDTFVEMVPPRTANKWMNDDLYYETVRNELNNMVRDDPEIRELVRLAHLDLTEQKDPGHREAQLIAISKAFYDQNKTPVVQYVLNAEPSTRHKFTPNKMKTFIEMEELRTLTPDVVMQRILENPTKYGVANTAKNLPALRQIIQNVGEDRIHRENGFYSQQEFVDRMELYWDMLNQMPSPIKKAVQAIKADIHKVVARDTNIAYEWIKEIQDQINHAPNNAISKQLDRALSNIIAEVEAGTITLNQAFHNINALNRVRKAQIASGQQLTSRISPAEVTKTTTTEDPITEDINKNYFKPYRDAGVFAFPGVQVDIGKIKAIKVNKEAYAMDAIDMDGLGQAIEKSETQNIKLGKTTTITMNDLLTSFKKEYKSLSDSEARYLSKELIKIWHDLALKPTGVESEVKKMVGTSPSKSSATKDQLEGAIETLLFDLQDIKDWIAGKPKPLSKPTTKAGLAQLRLIPKNPVRTTTRKPVKKVSLVQVPAVEINPSTALTADEKAANERKYAFDNLKYTKEIKKEEPEVNISHHHDGSMEFNVKTEADLTRMRTLVRSKGGLLYIVDLATGRLYPISIDKTVIQSTYIWKPYPINANKPLYAGEGGSFAYFPAQNAIFRDEEHLLPYKFMRDGRDKAMGRIHHVFKKPQKEFDFRDQIENEMGAGLWKHIKNGIKSAGKEIGHATVSAAKKFATATVQEGKNFYQQEKKNVRDIVQANRDFYNDPSLSRLFNATNATVFGAIKVATQPTWTAARELANVSDFVGDIPGLNLVKAGVEWAVPPLGVADALVHGVKNIGVGSNDKPRYLDAAINMGDALLGTGALKAVNSAETAVRVLNTGAKIADYATDTHVT